MFNIFRKQDKPYETAAFALYNQAMKAARNPDFYYEMDVPNTPEGRFEMIAIHVVMIIDRLNGDYQNTKDFSQALFDAMFADMDQSLRQIGLGDMTIPKRMRYLMKSFNARAHLYEGALKANDSSALEAVLHKNVFLNADGDVKALAMYMTEMRARLAAQSIEALISGQIDFGLEG